MHTIRYGYSFFFSFWAIRQGKHLVHNLRYGPHTRRYLLYLSRRLTAPATTGDATLVPDNERQPPLKGKKMLNPSISTLKGTLSGKHWSTMLSLSSVLLGICNSLVVKNLGSGTSISQPPSGPWILWLLITLEDPNILTLILPTCPEQNVWTVLGELVVRQTLNPNKRSLAKFSILYHTYSSVAGYKLIGEVCIWWAVKIQEFVWGLSEVTYNVMP